MAIPLLALGVIAAGALFGAGCNSFKEGVSESEGPQVKKNPPVKSESNFTSFCLNYFSEAKPDYKSYCIRLWENRDLNPEDFRVRETLWRYSQGYENFDGAKDLLKAEMESSGKQGENGITLWEGRKYCGDYLMRSWVAHENWGLDSNLTRQDKIFHHNCSTIVSKDKNQRKATLSEEQSQQLAEDPYEYFKAANGTTSPFQRLNELLVTSPKVDSLASHLFDHVLREQRVWLKAHPIPETLVKTEVASVAQSQAKPAQPEVQSVDAGMDAPR